MIPLTNSPAVSELGRTPSRRAAGAVQSFARACHSETHDPARRDAFAQ